MECLLSYPPKEYSHYISREGRGTNIGNLGKNVGDNARQTENNCYDRGLVNYLFIYQFVRNRI
jgi:hypothetical protein